jgi:hypothetical protein
MGGNDEEFPGGVAQPSGRPKPLAHARFGWRSSRFLNHLTINYRWNESTLRLFSALTTFGTALDIALQELRIESFFPADEATGVVH